MKPLVALTVVLVTIMVSGTPAHARLPGHATRKAATLKLVTVPRHRLGLSGNGWPHRRTVALAVHQGGTVRGLALRTTAKGTFLVGVDNIDMCTGIWAEARDLAGHRARVNGPVMGCPPPVSPPTPKLSVLKRTQRTTMHVVRVFGVPSARTITVSLGDALYFWQPGTGQPFYQVGAPDANLFLIAQGTTPARACAQPNCAQGFYWEWLAVRLGTTGIGLSPSCLDSKPPCELPSLEVTVNVVPSS